MNLKDWWCDENMHIKVGKGGLSLIRKGDLWSVPPHDFLLWQLWQMLKLVVNERERSAIVKPPPSSLFTGLLGMVVLQPTIWSPSSRRKTAWLQQAIKELFVLIY